MDKGYTTPTSKPSKKKTMPVKSPSSKSLFKAPDLTNRIPDVRPTSMRNHGPWKGGK